MKNKKLFLIAVMAVCVANLSVFAQEVPDHPKYVKWGDKSPDVWEKSWCDEWFDQIDTWEPGKAFSNDPNYIDDNFFISRVKLKPRFTNVNSQANKGLTEETEKNVCWWAPMGITDKTWGSLPRYAFEADNFNMWQYINIHGNWDRKWIRVPGAFNDVAHKNGVVTGATYFIDWAVKVDETPGANIAGKHITKLTTKVDGQFIYARKFVQMLKYYGIDGVGMNPEGHWSQTLTNAFQDFLIECHRLGEEELDWPFRVDWYAFVSNSGGLSSNGGTLSSANSNWFQKGGKRVTDMFFLDYAWGTSSLTTSEQTAISLGRSPKDVYAGFDQQGRGYGKSYWTQLAASPLSVVVWGGHDKSELYKQSNEHGSSDLAIQNAYLKKQEMLFTGGSRNVLKTPDVHNKNVSPSDADLKNFWGYSKFTSAKSTLQDLPFITRFNLGNGQWMRKEGEITWNRKWYNIGMQDYLPTWRWWIADDAGNIPADPINCDFTFEDAWFGGAALKVHGATTKSNIRLFKTKFAVVPNYTFSITYKVNSGTDPKMKIMISKEGAEDTFTSVALPAGQTGQWKTETFSLFQLGITSPATIACIGLSVENTDANYEVLIGEMSLMNPVTTFAPATPVVTKAVPLKRTYNSIDAKVIFESSPLKVKADGAPVYNEEVDTWYFEVHIRQGESEPILLTTTTSWATYVASAPLVDTENPNYEIGIRAVAPDGKTYSDFAWSGPMTSELIPVETLVIDKPIIKPDQTFTLGFEDPLHENADFEIIEAVSGNPVYSQNGVKTITTSLPKEGCYDVKVTSGDDVTLTRSMIIITPEATGRLPEISSITADKTNVAPNEQVNLTYIAEKGEGTVSQSIYITDPKALKVDMKILSGFPFTYALWFKPKEFSHGSKGTVLMQKINKNHAWTQDNWGEMWTVIRPKDFVINVGGVYKNTAYTMKGNEVSLNTWGGGAGSTYPHQDVVDDAISKDYSVTEGVWSHLAITMDANKKQCMYINGKLVFETTSSWTSKYDNTNFYVGGPTRNLAGFNGWIDEVQIWNKALTEEEVLESMQGYFNAPSGLQGYFTFEEMNADGSFPNYGENLLVEKAEVIEWKTNEEKTTQIDDIAVAPTLDLGVPALEGVREIVVESVRWTLPGANYTPNENGAVATYAANGTYSVSMNLRNSWGETSAKNDDYIIVSGGTSVDDNEAAGMVIYPNPFKETANILFADAGTYNVDIYGLSGNKVASQTYEVTENTVHTLAFNAPEGMYIVRIMKDGKCVKSFKLNKE